jgi:hypothetical protein
MNRCKGRQCNWVYNENVYKDTACDVCIMENGKVTGPVGLLAFLVRCIRQVSEPSE